MSRTLADNALLRVLVIDDQSHVRDWVRGVLKRMGITEITEAADGRDAIAAVTQPGASFDLILCDLQMPDQDGIETIRALAALGVESAIAIMSVEEERVIESAGVLAEVQGLRMLGTISKPLAPEKLAPILARMREVPGGQADPAVLAPERDFRNAFDRTELFLQYQPKVWMRTGKFAGVEALARWKHPELGVLQPASFVPAMDDDDRYHAPLAEFSLREALACAGRWHGAGRDLGIAINLSVRSFDRLDLPERIASLALDAHVPAAFITLEVPETHVVRASAAMIDVGTRLRLKGFRLCIDQFGTGQSGLSNLKQLPFNELKIDRSFVHGCSTSSAKRAVVEASLSLARNLKMTAVAAGIQQRPDWNLLDELGCDVMQGFFIARPMSEEGLEAWAAQWTLQQRQA